MPEQLRVNVSEQYYYTTSSAHIIIVQMHSNYSLIDALSTYIVFH